MPPSKGSTEGYGASYCLLISTETSRSSRETRVLITFLLRFGAFSNTIFSIKILAPRNYSFVDEFFLFLQCPCCSSPCQNGGICLSKHTEDDTFECLCKTGFTGKYCHKRRKCHTFLHAVPWHNCRSQVQEVLILESVSLTLLIHNIYCK